MSALHHQDRHYIAAVNAQRHRDTAAAAPSDQLK